MNVTNLAPGRTTTVVPAPAVVRLMLSGADSDLVALEIVDEAGRPAGGASRLSASESRLTGLEGHVRVRVVPAPGRKHLPDTLRARVQLGVGSGEHQQVVLSAWAGCGRLPFHDLLDLGAGDGSWTVRAFAAPVDVEPRTTDPAAVRQPDDRPVVEEDGVSWAGLVAREHAGAARAPDRELRRMRVLVDSSASMTHLQGDGSVRALLELLHGMDSVYGTQPGPTVHVGGGPLSRTGVAAEHRIGFRLLPAVTDVAFEGPAGRRWVVVVTDAVPVDIDDVRDQVAATDAQMTVVVVVLGRSRLDLVDGAAWSDPTRDQLARQRDDPGPPVVLVSLAAETGSVSESLRDDVFARRVIDGLVGVRRRAEEAS